jgi:LysR family transcriptional regulator, glycine cleavage system transcriptional activator
MARIPKERRVMARLPPLQTLQAFDAAARTLSFTAAAQEIHISQPAVSQQIRLLEDRLQVSLFHRFPPRLQLTPEGVIMAEAAREAINVLERAADAIQARARPSELIVAVTPSLSARWLVPRLQKFRLAAPETDVTILPAFTPAEMEQVDADIGLFYGAGGWAGWRCEQLHRESLFPVASPVLLQGAEFQDSDQIFSHTLLRDADAQHECWPIWLAAQGAKRRSVDRGPKFDNLSDVIEAAVSGQGIALARSLLVQDALAAGELVRLFAGDVAAEHAIHFVWGKRNRNPRAAQELRDWLVDELPESC